MAFKNVTLIPTPSKTIPDDYLSLVLEKNKSAVGIAMSMDGGILIDGGAAAGVLENIKKLLLDYSAADIVLSFGHHDAVYPDDDVQPFVALEDAEENPLMVAFLTGDFPGFAEPQSTHSPEFLAWAKYFKPKIDELNEKCDGDTDAIMAELEKVTTHTDFI